MAEADFEIPAECARLAARLTPNTVHLVAALICGAASQAAASRLFSTLGDGLSARLDTSVESAG